MSATGGPANVLVTFKKFSNVVTPLAIIEILSLGRSMTSMAVIQADRRSMALGSPAEDSS